MKSVDKNQIEAVSEKYRVAEITAEKVIWLTRVLAELSGSRIAEDFALMGGSAIVYLHADLGLKEKALARTAPPKTRAGRYRPDDALIAFLEGL